MQSLGAAERPFPTIFTEKEERMSRTIVVVVLLLVSLPVMHAQQEGPQGVLVNHCLSVTPVNGAYRFTNTCNFVIEVAAAQSHPNGQPNGSDTFQLFPNKSSFSGTTSIGVPRYWACSAPNGPEDYTTHAAPMSNSYNVVCPKGGTAGSAR
jgi:hypothetical protein